MDLCITPTYACNLKLQALCYGRAGQPQKPEMSLNGLQKYQRLKRCAHEIFSATAEEFHLFSFLFKAENCHAILQKKGIDK